MRIDRRTFLCLAAGFAACSERAVRSPLQSGVRYLWSQQAEDGGFHSTTYGLLRSGQSLTPFVLSALLDIPHEVFTPATGAVDRAFTFIRSHTNSSGELGRMDQGSADYPNYATALAVMAFMKAKPAGWERDVASMVAYLRSQQFSEGNGWKDGDAPFGGWGMGGEIRKPPEAGHVDISMTRCVMEALQASGVPASDPAMRRALRYLERSRNSDGGFYFSPVEAGINKAGERDGGFASYGTATADGVLALRAAGIAETDDRVARGVNWLAMHHRPDRVPGFDDGPRGDWAVGLRFYYAAVVSRVSPDLPITLPEQSADGSFRNANKMVKEDDPLIATTFAVEVLKKG